MMHFDGKKNISCKFYDYCPVSALLTRPNLKKLLYFQTFERKKIKFIVLQTRYHSNNIVNLHVSGVEVMTLGCQTVYMQIMFKNCLCFCWYRRENGCKLRRTIKSSTINFNSPKIGVSTIDRDRDCHLGSIYF